MWGTTRALIANMVKGVSTGYTKSLEITGTGYRAAVAGKNLEMNLGFSHPVVYPIPAGIKITCERPTAIKVEGVDKRLVGQVASEIRSFRPPEPYKGKGARYKPTRRSGVRKARRNELETKPSRSPPAASALSTASEIAWQAPAFGVPLGAEHLRAGDRRCEGTHAGGGFLAGQNLA